MEKIYTDNITGDYSLIKGASKDVIRSKYPKGSSLFLGIGNKTGPIRISFPVLNSDTFVNFKVKIFEFADDESFEMQISGYINTSGAWSRTSVQTIASKADRDFTIRFGNETIKDCIWIGELDTVWSYTLVSVTDFAGTYNNADKKWAEGWSIGVASSFDIIKVTKSNNFPYADESKVKNLYKNVPPATDPTHAVNLQQVEKLVGNKVLTQSVSGAVNLDVSEYGVFDLTLTAATDFTFINLPASGLTRPVTIYLTGAFAWTLSQGTEEASSDAYDGAINNRVQVDIVSGTKIFYQIQNL